MWIPGETRVSSFMSGYGLSKESYHLFLKSKIPENYFGDFTLLYIAESFI
jgi:hypothetical protein